MSSRPVTATTDSPTVGRPHLPPVGPSTSASRRSDRKAPLAWLPWVLLGLLLLTLVLTALLAKAAGDSDDVGRTGGSGATAPSTEGGAATSAALTAGSKELVGLPVGGLAALQGQSAQGTARVESVVADEGFWVGRSASERVFVFLTPQARRSAGESGFQVEPGQTVQLRGAVKGSSPEFARSAGVTDEEGARQLVEQGGYLEAAEVRLAP